MSQKMCSSLICATSVALDRWRKSWQTAMPKGQPLKGFSLTQICPGCARSQEAIDPMITPYNSFRTLCDLHLPQRSHFTFYRLCIKMIMHFLQGSSFIFFKFFGEFPAYTALPYAPKYSIKSFNVFTRAAPGFHKIPWSFLLLPFFLKRFGGLFLMEETLQSKNCSWASRYLPVQVQKLWPREDIHSNIHSSHIPLLTKMPGSLIPGVPASVSSAMVLPPCNCSAR